MDLFKCSLKTFLCELMSFDFQNIYFLFPGVRAKSGQPSVYTLPAGVTWTALFLSLMVPSFPLWGYWVPYPNTFPTPALRRPLPPTPVWREWALPPQHRLPAVAYTINRSQGSAKGKCFFSRQRSRNASNSRHLHIIFPGLSFSLQVSVRDIFVVLCCTKCRDARLISCTPRSRNRDIL